MTLRNRLFLGFALSLTLVVPLALGLEFEESGRAYRNHMLDQSKFVAELLQEKVIEPLDDIEADSKRRGHRGQWGQVRFDLASDQATVWTEDGGVTVPVGAKLLLKYLGQVPLVGEGYAFLLDQHGTLLATEQGGEVVELHLPLAVTERAFNLKGTDRTLIPVEDPLHHQPSDLVLLSVPRVGLAVGVTFPKSALDQQLRPLARSVGTLAVGLLVILWGLCYLLARRVTRPLEELTGVVRRTLDGEARLTLPTSDIKEVAELSEAFAKMRADLAAYVERIRVSTAENARVASELELARTIQGNAAFHLTVGDWQVSGKSEPAREVGGDFMDAFDLGDGRLALLIGDVSGKGIPAALYTLLARSGLKLGLSKGMSPAQALAQCNALLALDNPDSTFVSALVGVLEGRQLVWARAGHPTPLSGQGPLEGPNGPPLGLVSEVSYRETTSELDAWTYLLYTDGFSEAENAEGEFLGVEPLREVLAQEQGDPWALLATHRGQAEPSDDATALLLRPLA